MGALSRMFWGALFFIVIKMWIWIFKVFFEAIGFIFKGIGYLIGLIWSSIFSREKKPKQEIQERVTTENLTQCTECGSMEPSSLMTVCPDCGALLCSDCRKHHNCVAEAESHLYKEEPDSYRELDEATASYDSVSTAHNTRLVQKKNGKGRAITVIVLGIVFLLLYPILGNLSLVLFGISGVCVLVSSKGAKLTIAVFLLFLSVLVMDIYINGDRMVPLAISLPIVIFIGIYVIYLCLNPQKREREARTEHLISCSECGSQHPKTLMTYCSTCGAILCPSCKKYHGCITEPLTGEDKQHTERELSIVDTVSAELITCMGCGKQHPKSAMRKCHTCGAVLCPSCRKHHTCGEEMIECMGCGERYPKSSMRKCHTCGDVLCPSCRKHHVCGSRKNESMDDFLESEQEQMCDEKHETDASSEVSDAAIIHESTTDEAKEWLDKGQMYATGNGVEQDMKQAMYWYTKSAEANHPLAQLMIGLHHIQQGEFYDLKKASFWLRKAEKNELVFSEILPGVMDNIATSFWKAGYNDEALYWYTRGAEQGDAECQYTLGIQYIADLIVKKDYKKAIYWFEKADRQGYEGAHEKLSSTQYDLGNAYYYGWHGFKQDYTEAAKWFERSALNGYSEGQREIGICYLGGIGVHTNPEKAVHWLRNAADQGDSTAKTNLGIMYIHGNHVPENEAKAFRLIKEAAEAEEPDEEAFFLLGAFYCCSECVQQDLDKASYWLQKSIDENLNLDKIRELQRAYPKLRLSI